MSKRNKKNCFSALAIMVLAGFLVPLAASADSVTLPNPIACGDVMCVLVGVLRIFLGILALFATVMFVYGGFLMLSSGGNTDQIKKGKDTLVWASIGIVVVLLSWAAIHFIIDVIAKTTA